MILREENRNNRRKNCTGSAVFIINSVFRGFYQHHCTVSTFKSEVNPLYLYTFSLFFTQNTVHSLEWQIDVLFVRKAVLYETHYMDKM